MEDRRESLDFVAIENARVSYQVTVALWTYQGSLNWNRFNVMLTANSIIVAGIGIILPNARNLSVFAVALPLMGLFLCLAWASMMARGYAYREYWSSRAVEIEENEDFHFGIKIAKEAKPIEDKDKRDTKPKKSDAPVSNAESQPGAEVQDKPKPGVRFNWLARRGEQEPVSYFVIGVFAVIFVLALGSIIVTLRA